MKVEPELAYRLSIDYSVPEYTSHVEFLSQMTGLLSLEKSHTSEIIYSITHLCSNVSNRACLPSYVRLPRCGLTVLMLHLNEKS